MYKLLFFFMALTGCQIACSSLMAQTTTDTTNILCGETTALHLKPGINYLNLAKSDAVCDSMYLLDKFSFVKINQDVKSCKNFVSLYKIYRDHVKDADKQMADIINSYEGIIKSKDEAYNTVLKEYYTLNELLDKSIKQTTSAVETSKSSLTTLNNSLTTISSQSERVKEDLKELKSINRSNKLVFGLGGGLAGLIIGLFIAK